MNGRGGGAEGRDPAGAARSDGLGRTSAWCCPTRRDLDGAKAALDKATKLKPDFALGLEPPRTGRAQARAESRRRSRRRRAPASWSRRTAPSPPISAARFIEQKEAPRAAGECRAAVDLEPKNPLGALRADEGAGREGRLRRGEVGERPASRGCRVKPEAKQQADAIVGDLQEVAVRRG